MTNTLTEREPLDADRAMTRHLLWAVHHAHNLVGPDAAPRVLRRELNRILRGWSA